MNRFLALALLVSFLAGCAGSGFAAGPVASDPTLRAGAKIAVQYATLKLIDEKPEKAARVVAITDAALELAGQNPASLGALAAQVQALLPADLDAADRLLVANLTELVIAEVQRRTGADPTAVFADVRDVLGWVREAAELAAPR